MSTTRIALGVAAVALAVACLLVWQQLQSSRATSQQQLAGAVKPELAVSRPVTPAPEISPPPPPVSSETPEPVAHPVDTERMMRDPAYERAVMQDPEYRAAFIERRKNLFRHALKDMRDWVEMSDDTFEAFLQLEAEHVLDSAAVTPETGGGASSEALTRLREQMKQRQDREMEQLFGDRYPQYRAYTQAAHSRFKIAAINRQLPAAEAISGSDAKAVAMAMSNAEQSAVQALRSAWGLPGLDLHGTRLAPDRRIELERRKMESVRAAAAPLLSPAQLKLLEERLKADLASTEAHVQRQPARP
jgi:hypothetical protein